MQKFAVLDGKPQPQLRAMEQYLDCIRDTIRRDGFAVQSMFGDAKAPVIAYTIGLMDTPAQCELIVLSDDQQEIAALLKETSRLLQQGIRLNPGSTLEGIINRPVRVDDVEQIDGLRLCGVFRRTYPQLVENARFYQLHILNGHGAPHAGASNKPSASEGQSVRGYLKRARPAKAVV